MKITNASFSHDIAMLLKKFPKPKETQTNQPIKKTQHKASKTPNKQTKPPKTHNQNTTVRYFYIMTTFLSQNEFLYFQFV